MPTPDTYLPDTDYNALLDALTALDRDPAHQQPLRDRITEVLGEIGGVWPASIHPDAVDQIAVTSADMKAAKRYRQTLAMNEKARAKLTRA
ncbi:hypothetical protein [Sulfitobacter sp.]|uniref:hypothetical protein n=1 Tax=Sulfitobacter sp. TaxID=1903071 RepID=UPI003003176D